jgi:trans-aconitate methyltransferase
MAGLAKTNGTLNINCAEMQLNEAMDMISGAPIRTDIPTSWADLGCGDGLFTRALARLLAPGSTIVAFDLQCSNRDEITANRVHIRFRQSDFLSAGLSLPSLNGCMMANSLHYVREKTRLINNLKKHLAADGMFLIVEYDTVTANPWIPFPVDRDSLKKLFISAGYSNFMILGTRRSIYRNARLYASAIRS